MYIYMLDKIGPQSFLGRFKIDILICKFQKTICNYLQIIDIGVELIEPCQRPNFTNFVTTIIKIVNINLSKVIVFFILN